MTFRTNTLAACVIAAMMPLAASAAPTAAVQASSAETDSRAGAMVKAHAAKAEYVIVLNNKAALDGAYRSKGVDYKSVASDIDRSHIELTHHIRGIDAGAKVLGRTNLLSNTLLVAMEAGKAESLLTHPSVKSIAKAADLSEDQFNALVEPGVGLDNEEGEEGPVFKDYSGVQGVKVGIVSTGIDYTHSAFGGEGTVAAYAEALTMGPIDFDGTEVVYGGIDLNGENGQDYNPIEKNIAYENEWQGAFPTGKGTQLASIVMSQAPGAKLFPIKTYDISYDAEQDYTRARYPYNLMAMAMEYAVDPNGDGDISDRLDIVVVDALTSTQDGNYWFFGMDDPRNTSPTHQQVYNTILGNAAAWGTLVITDTGMDMIPDDVKLPGNEFNYNLAGAGTSASALTVGSAMDNGDGAMQVTDFTRIGPVRWSETMKPDLVAPSVELEVAMVGTGSETSTRTDSASAAAYMAGQAAQLMAARPELNALEVKALLVNTANHTVYKLDSMEQEDITRAGAGTANVAAASASPVVAWDRDNYQPWLSFGFVEAKDSMKLVKEISVRNLSDKEQTYEVAVSAHKDNPGLMWQYPDSITVPAGQQVSFPVELSVEPGMLNAWPIRDGVDHTVENFYNAAYTGFVSLTAADQPQIDLGWRIMPRAGGDIIKDHYSYSEHFYSQWNADYGWAPIEAVLGQNYWGQRQQFINNADTTRTFMAVPAIVRQTNENRRESARGQNGVRYTAAGGGIYDDLSGTCASGKKLTIAATFEKPLDIGVAYHPDKPSMGYDVMGISVITEEFMKANGLDQNHHTGYYPQDQDIVLNLWVGMDEEHRPTAWYTDYNKEYDWRDPAFRNTKSSLGVKFMGQGTTMVAEWCVDDLFHSKEAYDPDWNPYTITYDEVADFDKHFGWAFFSDRDTAPDVDNGNPMPMYNPVIKGTYEVLEIEDSWTGQIFEVPIDGTFSLTLNKDAPVEEVELVNQVTLAPGEAAYLNAFWRENEMGLRLPHDFMLLSLDDNFALNSSVNLVDGDGVDPSVRAGQVFTMAEDVADGTVLGRIQLDSESFFASYSQDYPPSIVVVNAVPGNPISIMDDGQVVVTNSAELDYEQLQEFSLEVAVFAGNRQTPATPVDFVITNVNDTAPAYGATSAGMIPNVSVHRGNNLEMNVSQYFTDADGDTLSFSATGLPKGFSIDATTGVISGSPAKKGDATVTVTASDGVHTTSATFDMEVDGFSSSSGTTAPLVLGLLSLLGLARRRQG